MREHQPGKLHSFNDGIDLPFTIDIQMTINCPCPLYWAFIGCYGIIGDPTT